MVIFGYKIERNETLRTNPFTLVYLCLIPLIFLAGAESSGYFADYRFGESIVPNEAQLVRSGPYVMDIQRTRSGPNILFIPPAGGRTFALRWTRFNRGVDIEQIALDNKGKPVAYLGLYESNPVTQVWRIDVGEQNVFSYDRALWGYRFDANPAGWLQTCLAVFFMFLCSLFTTTKVVPPKLSPQ